MSYAPTPKSAKASSGTRNRRRSMRILVITHRETQSACFCLRLGYFLDHLIKCGRIAEYRVNDLSYYSLADLVIIQREIPLTHKLVKLLISNPKPIIYETDDLLPQIPSHNPCYSLRATAAAQLKLLGCWKATFIASTPFLADKLKDYSENVNVIQNAPPFTFNTDTFEASNPLMLSFFGSRTHTRDFAIMGNVLERIAEKYPRLRFLFMGDAPHNLQPKLPLDYCPFHEDYPTTLERFRSYRPTIGLAPLIDNQFNRAKSAIKYIDYTYAGAVGIYSDIIPYRGIRGGLLAKNHPNQWYESICRLIENRELRKQLRARAIEDIQTRFSFAAEAVHFADILNYVVTEVEPPSSETRVKGIVRIAHQAKDAGQTAEFLEYVHSFYQHCLRGRVAVDDVLDTIAKLDIEDHHHIGINLISDVLETLNDSTKLTSLHKSWIGSFLTRPYARVSHLELEMYRLASKAQKARDFGKALPIFERILRKSTEIGNCSGAAFHLGEIALAMGDRSRARRFFNKCIALNPEHRKANDHLRIMATNRAA